jgi:hypothetical protein
VVRDRGANGGRGGWESVAAAGCCESLDKAGFADAVGPDNRSANEGLEEGRGGRLCIWSG